MSKGLVIVESPTKARTIKSFLGPDMVVTSTMGHIRDLPAGSFGVDVDKDFAPRYTTMRGKTKVVTELRKLAREAPEIFLATDEDREGEAIAWHAAIVMDLDPVSVKRVAFHEITPEAVKAAFHAPRTLSMPLVNAQQARRIVDRLVGYTLSPFIWRLLERGLSAGRVQSVALRLIVDREKEIDAFTPETFWTIAARVARGEERFLLRLVSIGGEKLDQLHFRERGPVDEAIAELQAGSLRVAGIERKERKLKPPPPFVTSTLQQDGSSRLGFPSAKTMAVAQQLYEGIPAGDEGTVGLITYMRTDSPSVAKSAQEEAFRLIRDTWGPEYVPDRPPVYKARLATAQEAHEAIRPTSVRRTPDTMKRFLTPEQEKIYRLVWERFVASQMQAAVVAGIVLTAENGRYAFQGEQNRVVFPGFTAVWPVKMDEGIACLGDIAEGETLPVEEYESEEKQTKPPARYTEASLIRTLEKFGIGRPSTYAPTISTLFARGYIAREKGNFRPLLVGRGVVEILVRFFPEIINVDFTARMEDDLDRVAEGTQEWTALLREFYGVFKPMLDRAGAEAGKDTSFLNKLFTGDKTCPKCGKPLAMKRSKFGVFLGCSGYPACDYTEEKDTSVPNPLSAGDKACPKCGKPLAMKRSKFGAFLGCSGYPACDYTERIKTNARRSRYRSGKRPGRPAVQG